MAEDKEKKKNKKFRIKWWWDSDDEEKALENPEYAKGLEKTEDAVKNKDMSKDEIQEKKEEILEKTLGSDGKTDQMEPGVRSAQSNGQKDAEAGSQGRREMDGRPHDQNPEDFKAARSDDKYSGSSKRPDEFPQGASNTTPHADENASRPANNTDYKAGTPVDGGNQKKSGNVQGIKNGGRDSKENKNGSDQTFDKAQKSSFFNWFGDKGNTENGKDNANRDTNVREPNRDDADIKDKRDFVHRGPEDNSKRKNEPLQQKGRESTSGEKPSYTSWFGRGNNTPNSKGADPNEQSGKTRSSNAQRGQHNGKSNVGNEKTAADIPGTARESSATKKDAINTPSDTKGKSHNLNINSKDADHKDAAGKSKSEVDGAKGPATNMGSKGKQPNVEYRDDKNAKQARDSDVIRAPGKDATEQASGKEDGSNKGPDEDYGSSILFCGYASLCLVLIFLFFTEVLWDCTVTFNMIPLICLLLMANLPFFMFLLFKSKISYLISVISVVVTVLLLLYLYKHRVRVYFYQISIDGVGEEQLSHIENQPWEERTSSVLELLRNNGIHLEEWIKSSRKPGAKVFILKHELGFEDKEYEYLSSMAKESLKQQVKELSPYESNGAVITFPIIRYSWSKEKALKILKEIASMKFSKIGENYALIIGIYPSVFDYSEIFGTEPVNISRIDGHSVSGEFDPMQANPKI